MPLTQNDFDKMDAIATSTVNVGSLTDEQFADMDNIANGAQQPVAQANPVLPQPPVVQNTELPNETFGNQQALEGSVSKASPWQLFRNNIRPAHFLRDFGKATVNAFRDESILGANAITGAKNWALDRLGIDHKSTEQVKREREELIPKFDLNPDAKVANFIGELAGWAPSFAAGGELVGAAGKGVQAARAANIAKTSKIDYNAAKEVLNSAQKAKQLKLSQSSKGKQILHDYLDFANKSGKDMAAFNAITHGSEVLAGDRKLKDMPLDVAEGYAGGAIAGPTLKAGSKAISYPIGKVIEKISSKHPLFASNIGAIVDALNIDVEKQSTVDTWKQINRLFAEANSPARTKYTAEEIALIKEFEKMPDEDKRIVLNELEHGSEQEGLSKEIQDAIRKEQKKSSTERKTTPETTENIQEDINTQEQNKNAKSDIQQDTDKVIEDIIDNQKYENVKVDNEKIAGPVKEQPVRNPKGKRIKPITKEEALANIKRNTGRQKTYIEPEIIKLQPGTAEGAEGSGSFYKRTEGSDDIYKDVIKEDTNSRVKQLSEADDQKLKDMLKKEGYDFVEDIKTNTYKLVKTTKNGKKKLVIGDELKNLRKRFHQYKQKELDRRGLSDDERIKAEQESARETETELEERGKYDDYEQQEDTLKYQEGIEAEAEPSYHNRFVSDVEDDVDFQKFYNEYTNLDAKSKEFKSGSRERKQYEDRKRILLSDAVASADKAGKARTFMENFKKQSEYDAQTGRARKIGDEITDQTGLEEFENVIKEYDKQGVIFKDEEILPEVGTRKHSAAFNKFVDGIQATIKTYTSNGKKPFDVMKAKIAGSYTKPEVVQNIYNDYINDILSKEVRPDVKGELIRRANEAVDDIENRLINKYGDKYKVDYTPLKKVEYDANTEYRNIAEQLREAQQSENVSEFERLLSKNGFRGKTSKEIYNIKQKHYETSVEQGYEQMEEMGWGVFTNELGKPEVAYNPVKAKEWAIEQANIKFANNPEKLAKDLKRLENPEVIKERSRAAFNELVNRKENIFRKDIENANHQRQQYKYDIEQNKSVATGDVWDRTTSGYDENAGKRKADELMRALKGADEDIYAEDRKDALHTAISDFVNGKEVNKAKFDGKTFDGKEIGSMTERFKKGSVMGDLLNNVQENIKVKVNGNSTSSKTTLIGDTIDISLGKGADANEELAHALFYNAAKGNTKLTKEVGKASDAANKLNQFIKENAPVLSKIRELQDAINANRKRLVSHKEILKKLNNIKQAKDIYTKFLEYKNAYKNTMAEQYSDCIKEGIFEGSPVEFSKLYSKIKPQFNKSVKEGKYEGTPEEFRKYFEKQVQKRQNSSVRSRNNGGNEGSRGTYGMVRGTSQRDGRVKSGDSQIENQKQIQKDLEQRSLFNVDEKEVPRTHIVANGIRDIVSTYEDIASKDFHWLAEGQKLGRLYMQDPLGRGSYFIQKFKKGDKVDPTRLKKAEKGGAYYHKTKEGISDREVDTAANINRTIRAIHTKRIFDSIAKAFDTKLPEKGAIPKGFKAVNRDLLSYSFMNDMSKDFYEVMSSGDVAIRSTFKTEEAIKDALDFTKRINANKPDMLIPEPLYNKMFGSTGENLEQYISRYCEGNGLIGLGKGSLKAIGYITDIVNDRFKKGVLTSWSFFMNNRIGNQIMIAAKDPTEYARSVIDALKIDRKALSADNVFNDANKLADMAVNGVKHPIKFMKDLVEAYETSFEKMPAELVDNSIVSAATEMGHGAIKSGYKGFDLWMEQLNGNAIDTSSLKAIKTPKVITGLPKNYIKLNGQTVPKGSKLVHTPKSIAVEVTNEVFATPNRVYMKIADKLQNINNFFENIERKQLYSSKARELYRVKSAAQRMVTTEEALKWLEKNPEYKGSVVKMVQDVLGDYNNFNNAEKRILKRIIPFYGWLRTITRNSISMWKENPVQFLAMMQLRDRWKNKDRDLEEYQRGNIPTNITDPRSGNKLLINKFPQAFPWETYNNLLDQSEGSVLSQISPTYKTLIEAGSGKKLFKGTEITSKRYKRQGTEKTGYKYLDLYTGKKLDSMPTSTRAGYVAKELGLKTIYPAFNSKFLNPSGIIQGVTNIKKNKGFLEPDKLYDADFGGYYDNEPLTDREGRPVLNKQGKIRRRNSSNILSEGTKLANRLGFALTNPNKMSTNEMLKEYRDNKKRKFESFVDEKTDKLLERAIEYKKKHKRK